MSLTPQRLGFVEAVRRLARGRGGIAAVGGEGPEPLRFSASLGLGFASADLVGIERGKDGTPHLITAFLALAGSSGVLPASYAERLRRDGDAPQPAAEFVDLLHHRLLALACRAALKHAPWLGDSVTWWRRAAALIGLEPEHGLEPRIARCAGLLSLRVVSAQAMQQLLQRHLDLPSCRITPLAGGWRATAPAWRARLGRTGPALRRGGRLGRRRSDPANALGLAIGPLSRERAAALAPGGSEHAAFTTLVRRMDRNGHDHRVALLTTGSEIAVARLGCGDAVGRGRRLGGRAQAAYAQRFTITT